MVSLMRACESLLRPVSRGQWFGLVAIVGLAAVLRLPTLGHQSLWFDEAATAIVVKGSLADVFHRVWDQEGSPPLYYLVLWCWVQVGGHGEAALRAVSAGAGLGVLPVAFLAVRRRAGARAALLAALLLAASPLLVWFSQEARAYSLLVLLVAIAGNLALRFDMTGERAAFMGSLVAGALALATHYFAAFLTVPLAVWLARHQRRPPSRRFRLAVAIPFAAGIALLPLALHQSDRAKGATVGGVGNRLAQLPKQLLVGYHAPDDTLLALIAGVLVVAALGVAATSLGPDLRRSVLWCLGLAACAVVPMVALGVVGSDYLNTRNAITALLPLSAALGIALSRAWMGPAVAAGLVAIGIATVVGVATHARFQRDDWRGALSALGPADVPRAIVSGGQSPLPVQYYEPRAALLAGPSARVQEIDVLDVARRVAGDDAAPPAPRSVAPPPGYRLVLTRQAELYTLQRYRAKRPHRLSRTLIASLAFAGTPRISIQRGR